MIPDDERDARRHRLAYRDPHVSADVVNKPLRGGKMRRATRDVISSAVEFLIFMQLQIAKTRVLRYVLLDVARGQRHRPGKGGEGARRAMNVAFSLTEGQDGKKSDEATIGEVAREFAVSLRTLRFYEDRGLMQPRRHGASRFYAPADRARLRIILKGKQLGFTLTEIRGLIDAAPDRGAEIEERLNAQQIAEQIGHLERQRGEIDTAIACLRAAQQRQGCVQSMVSA
jgi:DNA-binding transcriptional MerR regulator